MPAVHPADGRTTIIKFQNPKFKYQKPAAMGKRSLLFALVVIVAGAAPAQKLTVSVTDISAGSGILPDETKQLIRKLLNQLAAASAFDVVDI